jgi:hypothetical protein
MLQFEESEEEKWSVHQAPRSHAGSTGSRTLWVSELSCRLGSALVCFASECAQSVVNIIDVVAGLKVFRGDRPSALFNSVLNNDREKHALAKCLPRKPIPAKERS